MKKFLKILLIVIGIVFLIFAALICIGLFVDYDDHIENGRYTYEINHSENPNHADETGGQKSRNGANQEES